MRGLHFVRMKRPSGVHRWYVYAWRGGPLVVRRDSVRKPFFSMRDLSNLQKEFAKIVVHQDGSLGALVDAWRGNGRDIAPSGEWKAIPPAAKRAWSRFSGEILRRWSDVRLEPSPGGHWREEIIAWRDEFASPAAANAALGALETLLEFGRSRRLLAANPVAEIARRKPRWARPLVFWTDADIDRFTSCARKPSDAPLVDVLRLALLTGLPRKELVRIAWTDGESLAVQWPSAFARFLAAHARTRAAAAVIEFVQELTARPRLAGVQTLLVDRRGRPWTPAKLTKAFNRVRDRAGIRFWDASAETFRAKHLHDLRATACARLGELTGCGDWELARIFGWGSSRVAGALAMAAPRELAASNPVDSQQ